MTIALTLSFKIVARDTAGGNAYLNVNDSVIAFLTRHKFQSNGPSNTGRIYAASADCQLIIQQMVPQGYNLDAIKTVIAKEGRLSFVYQGQVYGEQPPANTTLNHYWTHLQRHLGLNAREKPVFAVVSSESCAVDALPWKEIAEVP
jgi:hypothetical protein